MEMIRGLIATACVFLVGCGDSRPFRLELTEASQQAVFMTSPGWTGIAGFPVFIERDPRGDRPMRNNDLPLFLLSPAEAVIRQKAGAQPLQPYSKVIRVEARIHLERSTAAVSSNPPSTNSVYSVVIDELIDAKWIPEPAPPKP
jgi:hypothetical protein